MEKDKSLIKVTGTSFRGYLNTGYGQLCSAFGEPADKGDGYKIDVQWILETPSGVATIYNYKDGHAYLGMKGLDLENIYVWHVGGTSIESFIWVQRKLLNSTDLAHNSGESRS